MDTLFPYTRRCQSPQYDVASGAMTGVEALLRWRHPELGLLGAGPLVTAARAARLERELTEHAHRIALTEIAAWPKPLAALRVSLNITRSEEQTSELQSLMRYSYADFRFKKKK